MTLRSSKKTRSTTSAVAWSSCGKLVVTVIGGSAPSGRNGSNGVRRSGRGSSACGVRVEHCREATRQPARRRQVQVFVRSVGVRAGPEDAGDDELGIGEHL